MKLGAFSISLNVKDLEASRQFYEGIGFVQFAGKKEHNYYIMKNGDAIVGLFFGMFPGNIITLNPGWDQSANQLESFDDVRTIQEAVKKNGINLLSEVEEGSSGAGSFMVQDPDGNVILFDQHVN